MQFETNGIKKLYNHSNKPMRVQDLKKTWINRNFRIQNIDGRYDQNEMKLYQ